MITVRFSSMPWCSRWKYCVPLRPIVSMSWRYIDLRIQQVLKYTHGPDTAVVYTTACARLPLLAVCVAVLLVPCARGVSS